MKIDQVCFYAPDHQEVNRIKAQFGLIDAKWIKDTVTAESTVWPFDKEINVAELQFNYDLGIEFEILRYIDGDHWHNNNPLLTTNGLPFISHIGIHLDDSEDFPKMELCKLVQETFTLSHTTEYLTTGAGAGRKYHYRIFEMSPGTYIKYIRRIHPNGNR